MKKLILCFLILLSIQTLSATELILELEDAKNIALPGEKSGQPTVFTGEPFKLRAVVKNADDQTGSIQIEGLEKLNVMGKSTHSNITMINGKFTSENSHFYDVYTNSDGMLEIGPAQVKQNGNIIKSNTIKFRSIKKSPDTKAVQENQTDRANNQNFGVKCELSADKQTIFEGEPLTITLKIKSFGQIAKIGMDTINFPGFQVKESEQPARRQEMIKNRVYEIVEKKFYLIPTKSGKFTINPAKIVYQVVVQKQRKPRGFFDDDFFSGFFNQGMLETHEIFSESLTLQVQPINQENIACDGVGKFNSFASSTDKTTALVNEAIALTLELTGEGNFEQIAAPKPQLEPFIKSYESKSEFTEDPAKGPFAGKKRFEFVIQIGQAGQVTIAAQKFKYFDTTSKTIQILESTPITIQVTQPAGEKQESYTQAQQPHAPEQKASSKTQNQVQDIYFIEQDGTISKKARWALPWWLLFLLLLIPAIFYFKIWQKLSSLLKQNRHFKKLSRKTYLNKFVRDFEMIKQKNRPEQLYYFFMNLLAKKFEILMQDLTHDKAIEKLATLKWELAKTDDFLDFLNDCASLHFITSQNQIDPKLSADLFKKGDYWIVLLTKH